MLCIVGVSVGGVIIGVRKNRGTAEIAWWMVLGAGFPLAVMLLGVTRHRGLARVAREQSSGEMVGGHRPLSAYR